MIVTAEAGNKLRTVNQELLNLAVYSARIYHHEGNQTQQYENQVSGKKCSQRPEGKNGQP
jgi:hypothetical protein